MKEMRGDGSWDGAACARLIVIKKRQSRKASLRRIHAVFFRPEQELKVKPSFPARFPTTWTKRRIYFFSFETIFSRNFPFRYTDTDVLLELSKELFRKTNRLDKDLVERRSSIRRAERNAKRNLQRTRPCCLSSLSLSIALPLRSSRRLPLFPALDYNTAHLTA